MASYANDITGHCSRTNGVPLRGIRSFQDSQGLLRVSRQSLCATSIGAIFAASHHVFSSLRAMQIAVVDAAQRHAN
jgi:hypothetical protein